MEQKEKQVVRLPKYEDLIKDDEMSLKDNALSVLLNQPPPADWIKLHPFAKDDEGKPIKYIPIERVEWLMSRIYGKWKPEVLREHLIANSIVVVVRVHYFNPVTHTWEWCDGIGAAVLQTDKDAGAADWNSIKSAAVQMAAPAAKSYAIKDACENIGKIFGRDVGRKRQLNYDHMLKTDKLDALVDELKNSKQ